MKLGIEHVEFQYESLKALDGVTYIVDRGAFLGVMGPNGSGKTTLLKCITNVLTPQVGAVLVENDDVRVLARPELARLMAVVPQSTSIDFAFTVFELVFMGRTPHIPRFKSETAHDIEIVRNALRLTRTAPLADRTFNELSGGERQRVIIARALAQEPKVLLLDEPTVHLDIGCQYEIMDLVKTLNRDRELTVIAVFHDINLASQYCDRLLLLQAGKIASSGTPQEVLTPQNIKDVYQIDALVKRNPLTNAVYITPCRSARANRAPNGKTVHLLCGGGSGAWFMKHLAELGFNVTAGVLNVLDTDYESAQMLKLDVVGELPFSRITRESHRTNLEFIERSDLVVLTDFPVGPTNLKNIEAAEYALKLKPLVLLARTPIAQRDHTRGRATERFARLIPNSIVVNDEQDALHHILHLTSS